MYYKLSKSCQIKKLSSIYEDFFGAIDNGVFVEVGALRLVLADFVSILSAPDTGSAYWALE